MQQQILRVAPYEWERDAGVGRNLHSGDMRQMRQRDSAYLAVKRAILSGQISAGQLLGEEWLAESLKISRTPIRESLAILEHEGYVAPAQGRGLCVRKMTRNEFISLCEASEMIDPFLASRAAENISAAHAMSIECVLNAADQAIASRNVYETLSAHREFHRLVGMASGNAALADFILKNEERADFFLVGMTDVISIHNLEISAKEHRIVYDWIVKRKSEKAAQAMIQHAQSLRRRFAGLFAEDES